MVFENISKMLFYLLTHIIHWFGAAASYSQSSISMHFAFLDSTNLRLKIKKKIFFRKFQKAKPEFAALRQLYT